MKFHVKENGDIGKCSAKTEDGCPFTAEGAEHFSNFKNATMFAEKIFEREEGLFNTFEKPNEENKTPVAYPTIHSKVTEEVLKNPDNYKVQWNKGRHFGQNLTTSNNDNLFFYGGSGSIYYAKDWEWDRSISRTTINAVDQSTGQEEELLIDSYEEGRIYFMPENYIITPEGELLDDEKPIKKTLKKDYQKEMVNCFLGNKEREKTFFKVNDKEIYLEKGEFNWRGQNVYAVYSNSEDLNKYSNKLIEENYTDTEEMILNNVEFFYTEDEMNKKFERDENLFKNMWWIVDHPSL